MSKLQELLDEFRNDKNWNTEYKSGGHRFDNEIAWIETMIKKYAETLKLPEDQVVELMEGKRDYSWPNYYQPANFPPLDSDNLIGVFDTFEAFKKHAEINYSGFRCGKCGNVGRHPQECDHRIDNDGKCDWTSYGLFNSGTSVIILENGLKAIQIFKPVPKSPLQTGEGKQDERN